MRDFLLYSGMLLLPVFFLLFIALRMRKKITYPHGLLPITYDRKATDFLLRYIRLYGDMLFDLILAFACAALLAGIPLGKEKKNAVILDCSLSMSRGLPGARPIDLAAKSLFKDRGNSNLDLFILTFDTKSKTTTLRQVNELLEDSSDSSAFIRRLELEAEFFSVDYAAIERLSEKHYASLRLITDNDYVSANNLAIERISVGAIRLAYPSQSYFDEVRKESVINFYSKDASRLEKILAVDDMGRLWPLKASDFTIQKLASGFSLRFRQAGVYAISESGCILPFNASGPPPAVKAEGKLAEKIGSVFATEADGSQDGGPYFTITEKRSGKRANSIRVRLAQEDVCVIDPTKTLGGLVASGHDVSFDLALTQASLVSTETSLPFLGGIRNSGPGTSSLPSRKAALMRVGDGYIFYEGDTLRAFHAPSEEYFPFPASAELLVSERPFPRWASFLALLLLYALKVLFTSGLTAPLLGRNKNS